ncbi:hypothetical protein [Streptomyces sp. NPDC048350]|uniref:hypothetical protein n=1 Tax=Streptomyces sp. NPDC048350 TaxID=3365538 RepID=UPI0037150249
MDDDILLDGHHKLEAAAADGRTVRLLSLLTLGESLAGAAHVAAGPSKALGSQQGGVA